MYQYSTIEEKMIISFRFTSWFDFLPFAPIMRHTELPVWWSWTPDNHVMDLKGRRCRIYLLLLWCTQQLIIDLPDCWLALQYIEESSSFIDWQFDCLFICLMFKKWSNSTHFRFVKITTQASEKHDNQHGKQSNYPYFELAPWNGVNIFNKGSNNAKHSFQHLLISV
jgi:hypothetical protein